MHFTGSMVALVTPMHEDGSVDKNALANLVEWHIAEKTTALIIAGTTGESATLEANEHADIIAFVVKQVAGRVPVIAGTGANATNKTVKLTEAAKNAKADACLIVTPYYNRPPQSGLFEHYKFVAEKTGIPIILYNVPSRTACDLLPDTVEKLSKVKNIIAIKEATGKIERTQEILDRCDKEFEIYSGDDPTALQLMLNGAKGVISVTANIAPAKMQAMSEAALNGEQNIADKLNNELNDLHHDLFVESNPIPTKWALQQMGKIQPGIRLPLLQLDKRYHDKVKQAMQKAGVI